MLVRTANEYKFATTIETEGEGAIGANGVNKESMFISKLTTVKIAGQSLANQVAFYSKSNNYNLIGSEIAKFFMVTLNFKEKELILTPISEIPVDSFKSFGIDMNTNENEIYISRIYKGLNGDKKGIELNDKVISVNKWTVDSLNLCDSFFKLRKTLSQSDNLDIKVVRDNIEMEFKLQKTELR